MVVVRVESGRQLERITAHRVWCRIPNAHLEDFRKFCHSFGKLEFERSNFVPIGRFSDSGFGGFSGNASRSSVRVLHHDGGITLKRERSIPVKINLAFRFGFQKCELQCSQSNLARDGFGILEVWIQVFRRLQGQGFCLGDHFIGGNGGTFASTHGSTLEQDRFVGKVMVRCDEISIGNQ